MAHRQTPSLTELEEQLGRLKKTNSLHLNSTAVSTVEIVSNNVRPLCFQGLTYLHNKYKKNITDQQHMRNLWRALAATWRLLKYSVIKDWSRTSSIELVTAELPMLAFTLVKNFLPGMWHTHIEGLIVKRIPAHAANWAPIHRSGHQSSMHKLVIRNHWRTPEI